MLGVVSWAAKEPPFRLPHSLIGTAKALQPAVPCERRAENRRSPGLGVSVSLWGGRDVRPNTWAARRDRASASSAIAAPSLPPTRPRCRRATGHPGSEAQPVGRLFGVMPGGFAPTIGRERKRIDADSLVRLACAEMPLLAFLAMRPISCERKRTGLN